MEALEVKFRNGTETTRRQKLRRGLQVIVDKKGTGRSSPSNDRAQNQLQRMVGMVAGCVIATCDEKPHAVEEKAFLLAAGVCLGGITCGNLRRRHVTPEHSQILIPCQSVEWFHLWHPSLQLLVGWAFDCYSTIQQR